MHVRRSSQLPPETLNSDYDLQYKDAASLRKFQETLKEEQFLHNSRLLNQHSPDAVHAMQLPFGTSQQFLMHPTLQGAYHPTPVPGMAPPMPFMAHNAPGPQATPPIPAGPVAGMHGMIQQPAAAVPGTQWAPRPVAPAGAMSAITAMPRPPPGIPLQQR